MRPDAHPQPKEAPMKKLALVFAVAALAALARPAAAPAAEALTTLSGEVLDLACYAASGAKGKEHAGCAKMCLKGGSPAGLLADDGTVYVLVDDHEHKKEYAKLKNLGGEKVKLTGKVSKQGNFTAFLVSKVEKG